MALSSRQEKLAQGIARGAALKVAWREAGYTGAAQSAHRALRNATLCARIAELRELSVKGIALSVERVVKEASILAMSSVEHYAIDARGNLVLAPGAPPDAMRAVSRVKKRTLLDRDGAPRAYEVDFALWDKPGSIKLVGQHLGMFAERHQVTLSVIPPRIAALDDAALDAEIALAEQKALPDKT